MKEIILILIGFSEGLVVGGALSAFLMVLDVVPRLIHFSNSERFIEFYQMLLIGGVICGALVNFYPFKIAKILFLNEIIVVVIGLIFGIFIGLIAAALTEVLKLLPILSKRLKLVNEMYELLFVIVLGKVLGSLIYWFFPTLWF